MIVKRGERFKADIESYVRDGRLGVQEQFAGPVDSAGRQQLAGSSVIVPPDALKKLGLPKVGCISKIRDTAVSLRATLEVSHSHLPSSPDLV